MSALSHPWLLGSGVLLLLVAYLLRRWAARHDLKDLAIDAAWQVAKAKGNLSAAADSEIARRVGEIAGEGSNVERARKVAGHAARHVMAQAANVAALVGGLLGAVLVGLAFFWK